MFQPSETVDFSKLKYDLVFTSPPYFKLEEYQQMPDYSSKQDFLQRFFIPVVLQAWRYLIPGGHLALNMPEAMFEAVKSLLPRIKTILHLPLANRHAVNASRQIGIGKKQEKRTENIYVWYKRKNEKTRKYKTSHNKTFKKNK
jgi:DNA modification methylase